MITNKPKNILLADDSIFFKIKLSTILMAAGHKVRLAGDGKEVIKDLQEGKEETDLLILDLHMPELDGFKVMEWMGENGYIGKVPLLTITGVYEPVAVIERLRSLGSEGLLIKGFTPEQVVYTINEVLYKDDTHGRKKYRVPVAAPVVLTVGDATHNGFLLNISATGIFLHTTKELPPNAAVGLKFALPGTERTFSLDATVKWSTPSDATNNLFVGAGVSFVSISAEDQQTIQDFVEEELKRLPVYY
ncbi:MAG: PilZ domain-containing protein [Thermodesulfobacteriota bacterium]